MTEKLRTGIIGCGKVAGMHAAAYTTIQRSAFTAVCDKDEKRAQEFASKYGVKAYTDVNEMVSKEKLDLVTVCTPHPAHKIPTIDALNAGANVLIEKPLASSLEDCDAMLEAARKMGKVIGMISQRRFYPPCLRMKRAIDEGKIGKPVLGTVFMFGWRDKTYYKSDPWRGTWKGEGGGVLVNQAPHQIDLLQWFMNDEIDELYGIAKNLNHPYIEVEDTALAIIKFKNGGIGNIIVSNSQKPGIYGKVHIHGENGYSVGVQTDGGAMFIAGMSNILEPPVNDLWSIPSEVDDLPGWVKEDSDFFNSINPTEYFHQLQIRDFIDALLEGRKPMVTGEEGRVTVEIFTAIYRSTRDNMPIKFPIKSEIDKNDFDSRGNNN
ncbi:MAG: Gfo/Idh/MocA family oxidoreductase [Peptostreptococcaceae bacterium]|nr:Gfo/Idh/MocA family oxidoreductase [Peptostreptococcaceae bacterium]